MLSSSVKPIIDEQNIGVASERCSEVFLNIVFIAVGLQLWVWEEVQDFLLIFL